MSGALNFLAGAARGWMQGREKVEEKERRTRMDQIVIDRAEREKRSAEREDRAAARQEQFQTELDAASKPTQVRAEPVVDAPATGEAADGVAAAPAQETWNVGGRRFTSMVDAAKAADAATAEQNNPDVVRSRQLDVVRRYNPTAAVQMETSGLTLDRERLDAKKMRRAVAVQDAQRTILQGGWSAVPGVWNRYDNGLDVTVREDGKGGAELTFLKNGQPAGKRVFSDLQTFMREAGATIDPDKYLTEEQQRRKEEKEHGLRERQVATQERVAADNARYHDGMLGVARTKASEGTAPAPLWDKTADEFLKSRYTVKDEATGVTSVDGNGLEFAKTIAIGLARQNGGDTTVALGRAFDIDNRIREFAKGDPAAIRAARAEYLKRLTAPSPQASSPAGAPAATGPNAVPASEQAARDAEAGQLMIQNEFGGDVARAQAEVARGRAELAKAPKGEGRAMAESQLARLQAGIDATLQQSGGAAPGGRMQQAAARVAAMRTGAELEAQMRVEQKEMEEPINSGKVARTMFSPEVRAYLDRKAAPAKAAEAKKEAAMAEENRRRSAEEFARQKRMRGG